MYLVFSLCGSSENSDSIKLFSSDKDNEYEEDEVIFLLFSDDKEGEFYDLAFIVNRSAEDRKPGGGGVRRW